MTQVRKSLLRASLRRERDAEIELRDGVLRLQPMRVSSTSAACP
jgi:hypothetical protein